MFIDTWIVFTAPPVIFLFGFLVCAMFTAGKVADAQDDPETREMLGQWLQMVHRIDRLKEIASSQQSVKSGRIIDVLEGGA